MIDLEQRLRTLNDAAIGDPPALEALRHRVQQRRLRGGAVTALIVLIGVAGVMWLRPRDDLDVATATPTLERSLRCPGTAHGFELPPPPFESGDGLPMSGTATRQAADAVAAVKPLGALATSVRTVDGRTWRREADGTVAVTAEVISVVEVLVPSAAQCPDAPYIYNGIPLLVRHPDTRQSSLGRRLAQAIAPYGRELVVSPEAHGGEPPPGADPGSYRAVGVLDGVYPLGTYRSPSPTGGQTCLQEATSTLACRSDGLGPEPSTTGFQDQIVWVNVPADAVAVGVTTLDGAAWERPVSGFAYFPLDRLDSWQSFEIKAFDAAGRLLASARWRSGESQLLRWRDGNGQLQSRTRSPTPRSSSAETSAPGHSG